MIYGSTAPFKEALANLSDRILSLVLVGCEKRGFVMQRQAVLEEMAKRGMIKAVVK